VTHVFDGCLRRVGVGRPSDRCRFFGWELSRRHDAQRGRTARLALADAVTGVRDGGDHRRAGAGLPALRQRPAPVRCGARGSGPGEVLGLHPADVDFIAGTVTVRRSRVVLLEKPQAFDADPKTDAGRRTVTIPPHVLPILAVHLETWAGSDRVFIGRNGRPMRGDAVRQAFDRARRKAGMPGFRFHDLRHTGQTLAASTGATTKDLMRRLGHASPAAANRYLHAVDGRDAQIAAALSELAEHGDASRLPKSIVIKH
jgi:integrase